MDIEVLVVGNYQTNCYLLKQDKKVLIIDPGDEFDKIKESVGTDQVVGILLTHRHFDHVGALDKCIKEYQVPVYEYKILEEKDYVLGPFHFRLLYTPGHTKDSVIYIFEDYSIIFTGDFIFEGTIGRMDLGGNVESMKKSINKTCTLFESLMKNYTLYPGHGKKTTVAQELLTNPYLKKIKRK